MLCVIVCGLLLSCRDVVAYHSYEEPEDADSSDVDFDDNYDSENIFTTTPVAIHDAEYHTRVRRYGDQSAVRTLSHEEIYEVKDALKHIMADRNIEYQTITTSFTKTKTGRNAKRRVTTKDPPNTGLTRYDTTPNLNAYDDLIEELLVNAKRAAIPDKNRESDETTSQIDYSTADVIRSESVMPHRSSWEPSRSSLQNIINTSPGVIYDSLYGITKSSRSQADNFPLDITSEIPLALEEEKEIEEEVGKQLEGRTESNKGEKKEKGTQTGDGTGRSGETEEEIAGLTSDGTKRNEGTEKAIRQTEDGSVRSEGAEDGIGGQSPEGTEKSQWTKIVVEGQTPHRTESSKEREDAIWAQTGDLLVRSQGEEQVKGLTADGKREGVGTQIIVPRQGEKTTTTNVTTTTKAIDIPALLGIIANLTYDYESNLTRLFNESLQKYNIPTCKTPTTITEETTTSDHDYLNATVVAKCFVCGLKMPEIPRNAYCADAFAGDFLPLVPVDPRARGQIAQYRKYCRYLDVNGYLETPLDPRSVYGRFTGGCSVRWIDLSGVYTQRACRNRRHAVMGKHFGSKRMAKLEMALKTVDNGCIISPMASLVPLSRGISLYARFYACVCTGSWCNRAVVNQSWMVYIILLSFWAIREIIT